MTTANRPDASLTLARALTGHLPGWACEVSAASDWPHLVSRRNPRASIRVVVDGARVELHDVSPFLFEVGVVAVSDDEMVSVDFEGGRFETFWPEELEPLADVHMPAMGVG